MSFEELKKARHQAKEGLQRVKSLIEAKEKEIAKLDKFLNSDMGANHGEGVINEIETQRTEKKAELVELKEEYDQAKKELAIAEEEYQKFIEEEK